MITFWSPFTTLSKVRNFVYQPYGRTPNLYEIHKLILKEIFNLHVLSGLQYSSVTQSCLTLCDPMDCSTSVFPVHHQLLELTQTHVHRVGDAIHPSHPLSSPSPPAPIPPSIRVSSNESVLHIRWPKYWSFNFNISPSNEYSELILFRIDWLEILAVQGTLNSLLQHHSSKTSIFGAQLSL